MISSDTGCPAPKSGNQPVKPPPGKAALGHAYLIAFIAAVAGVYTARMLSEPPRKSESELHAFLHNELQLDRNQEAKIEAIEARFAVRKKALELEMRAANARLAEAIELERGYGPKVTGAVDHVHQVMGAMQKDTLEHLFEMRGVMNADQARRFDKTVVQALTADAPPLTEKVSPDLSQCSDGELAALAISGENRAYREYLRRYREPVYRLVRGNIRDDDEALDVTQETFVAAFAALKRYDAERPFKLWIARIALNKCRDWGRRRAVRSFFTRATPIDDAFDLASDSASPETEAGDRAELARVGKAIARLPVKLREVLVLRAIEGMTQAEAAEALGVSDKAVETRLYRARLVLAAMLSEKF